MSQIVDLYTIQIITDTGMGAQLLNPRRTDALMFETEQNLTDLLPDGYRARIRRWDDPNPGDTDDR